MLRLILALLLGTVGLGVSAKPANAACQALAACTCTATTTGVSFGAYNMLAGSPTDSTGRIDVRCTLLLPLAGSYEVAISAGSSGDPSARTLRQGANQLRYNLYTQASRSQVWGDGANGTVKVTQTFAALLAVNQSLTVYGRIPAGQNVAPGGYTDTLTVTIYY